MRKLLIMVIMILAIVSLVACDESDICTRNGGEYKDTGENNTLIVYSNINGVQIPNVIITDIYACYDSNGEIME